MSNIATTGREDFASGLGEDLFGDGNTHGSAYNSEKPNGESPEAPEKPVTDDSTTQENKEGTEEKPVEETPTDNPPNPEDTTTPEAPESKEEKKNKDEEIEAGADPTKPLKIGKLEFATTEDALAEATRVIGRNAQLAGDVNSLTESVQSLQTQLQEALQANDEWAKFYDAEAKKANLDPTLIAKRAIEEFKRSEQLEKSQETVKQEFDQVLKSPHYATVFPTLSKLAKQTNPLTGSKYTPREAYDYALWVHKITPEAETTDPTPIPPPSKVPAKMVAKPAGANRSGGGKETKPKDEYDQALDGYFTGVR